MLLRSALLLFVIAFLTSIGGFARDAEARAVALVVGIAQYDQLTKLRNPERDAAAVADRLRDQGFEVIEAFNADRFSLTRATRRFTQEARGADLALFYFAGHGVQLFDRNVLIARDADPDTARKISDLGLDMSEFMDELRRAGPVRFALLIDACRDNPLGFDETVALIRRLGANDAVVSEDAARSAAVARRGLANISLPANEGGTGSAEALIFFAAQPGQSSLDGEGQNSFFVEGLREALGNTNRPFSAVLRDAGAYVRTVTRGEQVPQLVSDWTEDPVLGKSSGAHIRYINSFKAKGPGDLSDAELKQVGEAQRTWSIFTGTFVAKESQAFTDSHKAAEQSVRDQVRKIGSVNGFAIDYDIDRDGRDETLAIYFLQTNVVMTVTDEGVTLRDSPCWDFGGKEVEAVAVALRDINGDRRPEIFVHYVTEIGSWGNLCVMEYVGVEDLASRRRAMHGTDWAPVSLFRMLMRHDGAWTVRVGEDNSIETCAGSNCHTRSSYQFDGTYFTQTLDESERPKGPEAKPFRDEAERQRIRQANAAPPEIQPVNDARSDIEQYVSKVYLAGGEAGDASRILYEPKVLYYGKPATRASILKDKTRYFARWTARRYEMIPQTFSATPKKGKSGWYDVTFDYMFEVSNAKRRIEGRGRTRLSLRQTSAGFSIAREEGEVLK